MNLKYLVIVLFAISARVLGNVENVTMTSPSVISILLNNETIPQESLKPLVRKKRV